MKEAATLSGEGNVDQAIATVKQALDKDPAIVEGYMLLGNFYKKQKRPDAAIAAYWEALARDSEHQNALFSLALAYKDKGRLDEARVGFDRARDLDPRNGKVLWQLADLWMRKGDFARAEAIINDGLERKVDEQRLLLKLAEGRIEAGAGQVRGTVALRVARRTVDLDRLCVIDLAVERFLDCATLGMMAVRDQLNARDQARRFGWHESVSARPSRA
jgi:tetratricopeptide (TPR) repeat protein